MLIALDPLVRRLTGQARGAVVIVDARRNNPLIDSEGDTAMEVVDIEGETRPLETVTVDAGRRGGRAICHSTCSSPE